MFEFLPSREPNAAVSHTLVATLFAPALGSVLESCAGLNMAKHQMANFIAILFQVRLPARALWRRRNLGWAGSVWKQQLLPGRVCESLACPGRGCGTCWRSHPARPRAAMTQPRWNPARSNQGCWQAGTESWQHNKGTLVSLKFLGSFGQGAGVWSHGRVGVCIAAVGPGDRAVGLGAGLAAQGLSCVPPSWHQLGSSLFFFP